MAVLSYTQDAVLGAYQQWLMAQGAQACLERRVLGQDQPNCANVAGAIVAQAGSFIRYSVLTTLSSVNVFFTGQFQTEAGMWQNVAETVVGTSAGGIDQVTRPATPGCYRTFVASVGSAVVAGSEVYVLAELGRTNNGAFQPYAILVSGYIRTNEPIDSTPGTGVKNPPTSSGGGGGCCMTTLYDATFDPDVSAYTVTVPSGANGRLIMVNATYVASGSAGNRSINLQLNPASGFGWQDTNQNVQTAGQTKGYVWQIEGPTYTDVGTGDLYRGLPSSLWFSGNFTVELRANNPQVGDNWHTSDLTYEIKGP